MFWDKTNKFRLTIKGSEFQISYNILQLKLSTEGHYFLTPFLLTNENFLEKKSAETKCTREEPSIPLTRRGAKGKASLRTPTRSPSTLKINGEK